MGMPKRVKKRRKIEQDEDAPGDNAGGWEEFFDYIFPEDEGAKPNLKLLAMAKMWKKQKDTTTTETEEVKDEPVEERIPIAEEIEQNLENPDADDEDIRNESSDESSESEDEGHSPCE